MTDDTSSFLYEKMINEPICKMVAAILAANQGGIDEAMNSLVEATGVNPETPSLPEQQLLVISSHMADLFSRAITIIARDRNMDPDDILQKLAISAMS